MSNMLNNFKWITHITDSDYIVLYPIKDKKDYDQYIRWSYSEFNLDDGSSIELTPNQTIQYAKSHLNKIFNLSKLKNKSIIENFLIKKGIDKSRIKY